MPLFMFFTHITISGILMMVIAIDIFSNQCDIYKVPKMVHGNRSDDHCSQSDNTAIYRYYYLLLLELY